MLIENQSSLTKHLINRLRNSTTTPYLFRNTIKSITELLIHDALNDIKPNKEQIPTWLDPIEVDTYNESDFIFIPILRAGAPMLEAAINLLPNAQSGFIAIKRNEMTAKPDLQYSNLPSLKDKTVILLDPMVATAGSLMSAITKVTEEKPKKVIGLHVIGCEFARTQLDKNHSDIPFYFAQIDPDLDNQNYIRPGLGDAGDRAFNT